MEVKQVKELMVAMGRYGVKRMSIEREGLKIEIERELQGSFSQQVPDAFKEENPMKIDFENHKALGPVRSENSLGDLKIDGIPREREDELAVFVTSPMVGIAYHSPSPNTASFVKVGDKVEKDTIVCVIEAMKVMNEVKAGISGIIREVIIDDNQPVEYGTKLFRISSN